MKMRKLFCFSLMVLMLTAGSAWAGKYTAGLGVGAAPDYEGSEDYEAVPLLMFKGNYDSGRYFEFLFTKFRLNIIPDETFSFGPVLNYRMERNQVDNDQVDDMDEIDGELEAGAFGRVNIDNFFLGLEFLADISDESDGMLVEVSAGYKWKATPELVIVPSVFSTYADSDYMDTYFSVNSGNRGSSTLPNFNADSGIKDVGINVAVSFNPWEKWGLMGLMSYKALLNDAKDSPIVDDEGDDNQMFVGVLATYRWGN